MSFEYLSILFFIAYIDTFSHLWRLASKIFEIRNLYN